MKRFLTPSLALLSFCLAPTALARTNLTTEQLLERMSAGESVLQGEELEHAIRAADAFPLGHQKNPVRVSQPKGERDYLAQLRCGNGAPPAFERLGSTGESPFGNIMDIYFIRCPESTPAESQIYMDMYHKGFSEPRPVPGFGIAP